MPVKNWQVNKDDAKFDDRGSKLVTRLSIMSSSSLSPEENPDTEAGPDIADLGQFQEDSFQPSSDEGGQLDVDHLDRQSLYNKQGEVGSERSDLKGKINTRQIAFVGDKGRRTSQGSAGGGRISELEKELRDKHHDLENSKKNLKIRRESEDQMKQVLKEYEKTISDLIAEKESDKTKMEADVANAVSEKTQAVEDLHNVEAAFADVHRKYERTKQVVEGFKKNEEQLKNYVEEYKDKLKKQDQKYNLLKAHAEEKLEEANREIDKIARSQDSEKAKLTAMLQKTEMKVRNMERTLAQKMKENEELTNICDDLIAKVGM
eukprot:GFUD01026611.1.p1 GENE.GFUD01026611.1~~GFUD01026611.1.p1  ORF type:complete len:319 (+),score=107.04 GFUD01026611.1:81-1037(+)